MCRFDWDEEVRRSQSFLSLHTPLLLESCEETPEAYLRTEPSGEDAAKACKVLRPVEADILAVTTDYAESHINYE